MLWFQSFVTIRCLMAVQECYFIHFSNAYISTYIASFNILTSSTNYLNDTFNSNQKYFNIH